jgi:hypothetical protein
LLKNFSQLVQECMFPVQPWQLRLGDNVCSEWETCPHCGADLKKLPGIVRIERAIKDGRTFVGTKQTARRKEWVN